jgi:LPS-assembly protein
LKILSNILQKSTARTMPYRLATLACALAAAAQAAAQAPEPGATTLDAGKIEGISDLEVTARGAAEIQRDDVIIFGDYLRYNREFGKVEGREGVRMQSGVDRISGPNLQYNMLDDTGVLEQPRFLMQRERPARGTAERLEFVGKNHYRFFNASFTTCQPGQDDWFLQAKELELDYDNDEGRAKSPRLRFFDHTLFAFPYAEFPLENRRRSGVLHPYYATTSTRGLEFGVPYYWNIAPERDAMFTPVWMARRGFQLKTETRYLGRPYGGELRYEYLPDDPVFGKTRSGLTWQHAQTITPTLIGQVDFNKVSDSRYFVDLSSQVRQLSLGNLPQDAYLTKETLLGGDGSFVGQARVQRFQTLQDPLSPVTAPYWRLPQLTGTATYNNVAGRFDTVLPGEFVRFVSETQPVEGSRMTLAPTFAAPKVTPGWYVTPKTGLRYSAYSLDRPAGASEPRSLSSAIPWFSFDSGMVFERGLTSFVQGGTQTLEPRLYYLYVPYRNQDNIPLFDTTLADFNFPQLFSENRFVGGDRFGDANQLTLAMTTRFLRPNGQETFRAMLGQRYYFANERVGLAPGAALRSANESDVLAAIGTRLRAWTFDALTQYDPSQHRLERYGVQTRYIPERGRLLNASYRYQRDTLRQLDVSGQWPVYAGWYGVGRYNYSLQDHRLLEGLAGAEYNAGCWIFRFVVQRIQAATRVASSTLIFQLEFTGVGQVGTAEAVQLLRRDVPGYSVLNSVDPSAAPPSARPRLPFEQVY